MPRQVSTRAERLPDDGDFLLCVYACTRRAELAGLGWPEEQQDAFIRMQFDAQTRHYRESFPDATHSVICIDGELAGRLIIDRAGDQILIVDIALLPEFRRKGVGDMLVRRLADQADAGHLPVRCHVRHDSTARQFWEHAGFIAHGRDGAYLAMERAPRGRPP
ncbi:MAG TPA: GNAT family N-acetyltransferase [Streptosporangiaceae bacterium]